MQQYYSGIQSSRAEVLHYYSFALKQHRKGMEGL
jgi:hypothetical protein